jgi:hypothetical protein
MELLSVYTVYMLVSVYLVYERITELARIYLEPLQVLTIGIKN